MDEVQDEGQKDAGEGKSDDRLFLGLDSSTQGLKATAVDAANNVVYSAAINYDESLPDFKTENGMHTEGTTVTSPVLMWVSALDLLLARMQTEGFAFGRVAAVSGSGQQHGSVYWGGDGEALLAGMGGDAPLAAQLKDAFAHHASPIWADSSTSAQCSALEAAMGSPQTVATVTGSRAYERFTGNQIAKISETFPEAYAATARVSLVSSFMSSIFLGRIAPIDLSDGSGMNLLDIRSRDWSGDALAAHAGAADLAAGLASRLGPVVPSHAVLGTIHGYFQGKFGFPASCALVAWSGDNPCSMAGLGLEAAGDIAISLGTSDTMFGVTADPKPGLEGHIFVSPVDPTSYMAMLCYKNGSLAREAIRDQHQAALAAALAAEGDAEGDVWAGFNAALERTPAGNQGNIGFYHFAPEITPNTGDRSGVYRFAPDMRSVDAFEDAAVDVRALVEGQFLSMRVHSEAVGINDPKRIVVTGGASQNTNIVQVVADVFGVPVFANTQSDSASLGAAFRAKHALACSLHGPAESTVAPHVSFVSSIAPGPEQVQVATPKVDRQIYDELLSRYREIEHTCFSDL